MAKTLVKEGSTSYHPLTITAADDSPVVPESLRYRLMEAEGVEVIAWTTIPNDSTSIEIPAASNLIGAGGRKRYLTVEATHNGGDKITSEIEYQLVNLKGIAPPV